MGSAANTKCSEGDQSKNERTERKEKGRVKKGGMESEGGMR